MNLLLHAKIAEARAKNDTTELVKNLIKQAYILANQAKYNKSYDGYWEILELAELSKNEQAKAAAYHGLGWLYGLYGSIDKAKENFGISLGLYQKLVGPNAKDEEQIHPQISIYFALASISRILENHDEAIMYLDSCRYIRRKYGFEEEPGKYLLAEYAYIDLRKGRVKEALKNMLELISYFETLDPSYQVVLFPYVAEAYEEQGEFYKAEEFYQKAISVANKYSWHLDILPDIYEDLAKLYLKMGLPNKAYGHLLISKKQSESMFGSRSQMNSGVLEVKDTYRLNKEEQDKLIKEQRLETLEQEARISGLKNMLLYGAVFALLVFGFLLYRHLRQRFKAEKRFLNHQRAIELEIKNKELESKNKELTASALKSIEREELLSDIRHELSELKQKSEAPEVSKMMKSINNRISHSWEEFDLRFKSVHEDFYSRLKEKFPALSTTDHKLCALIKLNFNSKDMARLMGISIESVHTNRYRLRKKLGLERKDNLENFVAVI
ncbi:MAG: hypothetical protein AAF696_30210 [Bacteroidota bacterium]